MIMTCTSSNKISSSNRGTSVFKKFQFHQGKNPSGSVCLKYESLILSKNPFILSDFSKSSSGNSEK